MTIDMSVINHVWPPLSDLSTDIADHVLVDVDFEWAALFHNQTR